MPRSQKSNSSMASVVDTRDEGVRSRKWVIIQLTSAGERETRIPILKKAIHRILRRELDVFIPAISQQVREDSQTIAFMEGYIFIEYVNGVSYLELQDTTFFSVVLCNSQREDRIPQYSLLDDRQLDPLREGMNNLKFGDFKVGNRVRIIKGSYKNLVGKVTLVLNDGQHAQVLADLLSKDLLMEFPITYLVKIDE